MLELEAYDLTATVRFTTCRGAVVHVPAELYNCSAHVRARYGALEGPTVSPICSGILRVDAFRDSSRVRGFAKPWWL
jgi:hypothetical protein